jgi:adenosylmethionine-8-amino-7-oxononanoate aminotransferase
MREASPPDWLQLDLDHVWHPYSPRRMALPPFAVESARGVRLKLADGRELIDGMSSWWCAIHGYNHPRLNAAITQQLGQMAHVMFGGLTHEPAARLARKLIDLTPPGLAHVFFADSGSVAVEVALKMAIQYWQARGEPERQRFIALRNAYHGDTLGAMSVCDPETGMHRLFAQALPRQYFAAQPRCRFEADFDEAGDASLQSMRRLMEAHGPELAAVIVEPVVQGAGGMWFYSPRYLKALRALCDRQGVLLIADEIATGFGRSGRLFACEWAGITPDILCLGKALTGGYLTLAATLCRDEISAAIDAAPPGAFMHGPTFMANPLACAVANASIDLLLESGWAARVRRIEQGLKKGLSPCAALPQVADVRVLGAIGVVELNQPVDMQRIQPALVEAGVWVRPFGRLVYLMPPFVIDEADLRRLCQAVCSVIGETTD